jgi:small subunit ribosomal protein S20
LQLLSGRRPLIRVICVIRGSFALAVAFAAKPPFLIRVHPRFSASY